MKERNLLVYLNTHGCFQVNIKTHEKETWRRETSQFFSKHTLSVYRIYSNVIFVTIAVFKLILKQMEKKNMEERNLIVFLKTHTCSSWNLFQFDICDYFCFQVDFKTHEKLMWRRETSQFFLSNVIPFDSQGRTPSQNGGSASRIHQHTAKKGGSASRIHQPKRGSASRIH